MSFVNKLVRDGVKPIYYIKCKDLRARDCFYFLLSTPEKMKQLAKVGDDEEYNLNDYGQIIVSGFGQAPSSAIKKMLLDNYGFNADDVINK